MSHITTYTGKHFDPVRPDPKLFDIRDIAHALSFTCRGNGHVKTFFSVGQHCVNCALEAEARGYSDRLILACLLHDASEAYMSDVPRPFKESMPDYIEAEAHMLDLIYEKFLGERLNDEEQYLLKLIDDDLLYFDMRDLLGAALEEEEPKLKTAIHYEFEPFDEVEKKYLEIYEKYQIK